MWVNFANPSEVHNLYYTQSTLFFINSLQMGELEVGSLKLQYLPGKIRKILKGMTDEDLIIF